MSFLNLYIKSLKKSFEINTRATRAEFFTFTGINFLISFLLLLLNIDSAYNIFSILSLIPSVTIGIRRFHDTGRSGWKALYSLIPVFGIFYWFYVVLSRSEASKNKYGSPQYDTLIGLKTKFNMKKDKEFEFEFKD